MSEHFCSVLHDAGWSCLLCLVSGVGLGLPGLTLLKLCTETALPAM